MSNITSLAAVRKQRKAALPPVVELPPATVSTTTEVQDLVYDIYSWANENEIDTESKTFKFGLASISATLQGMLCRETN